MRKHYRYQNDTPVIITLLISATCHRPPYIEQDLGPGSSPQRSAALKEVEARREDLLNLLQGHQGIEWQVRERVG